MTTAEGYIELAEQAIGKATQPPPPYSSEHYLTEAQIWASLAIAKAQLESK